MSCLSDSTQLVIQVTGLLKETDAVTWVTLVQSRCVTVTSSSV